MARRKTNPAGYFRIGKFYISTTFMLGTSLGLLALVFLYATILHPLVMNKWYAMQRLPEFRIDSPFLASYTGNARLILPSGSLLYEGGIEAAAAQGSGVLYDNGSLVYDGDFVQNLYHGNGTLYYPDGSIKYEGGFLENNYSGEGRLYDDMGNMLYIGTFSSGLYVGQGTLHVERDGIHYTYVGDFDSGTQNGSGKLYAANELIYEGEFKDGVYHGEGVEYIDGYVIYSGGFVGGKYEGEGKLYSGGFLRYLGGFANALFNGKGILYENGKIAYEGDFINGSYSGVGKQYSNGALCYDGEFFKGKYSGAGKLFDENGLLLYDGEFIAGNYSGEGKLYMGGVLLYEGGFENGKYNGEGTEFDILTGFPIFEGKYSEGIPMEAGTEFTEDGNPVIPPPEPPSNPTSYLNSHYTDVMTALKKTQAALKEQYADGMLLVVDSDSEVVYCFSVLDEEQPGFLLYIYYYGLMSAEGIVAGSYISDIQTEPDNGYVINTADTIVLGYSNKSTGQDIPISEVYATALRGEKYNVTAYYWQVPFGDSVKGDDEALPSTDATPNIGTRNKVLFLRIEIPSVG